MPKRTYKPHTNEKSPGRPFQKGSIPNPWGRAGKNPVLTELKKEAKDSLMQSLAKVIEMPAEEVEVLAGSKSAKSSDALMAAVMTKGIKSGSPMHAQFFMAYTFGRPIEYNPEDEKEIEAIKGNAEALPREVLTEILKGLKNARESSAIPTGS